MRVFAVAVPHDEVRAKQYQCRAPFNRADVVVVRLPRYATGQWHAPYFAPVLWDVLTGLTVDGKLVGLVSRNANGTLHWSPLTDECVARDGWEIASDIARLEEASSAR